MIFNKTGYRAVSVRQQRSIKSPLEPYARAYNELAVTVTAAAGTKIRATVGRQGVKR